MGPEITAIAYTSAAVIGGLFFAFQIFDNAKRGLLIRIAILWCVGTAAAFLAPQKLLALIVVAVLLLVLGPRKPTERIFLYIASLALLPSYYNAEVPFPGLNYLMVLDYPKVATLILLGPLFLSSLFSKAPSHLRSVDRYLLLFVLLTSIMSIRDLPFTSMMRVTVDHFLLIFIPYVVISRGLKTVDDLDLAVKVFFFSIVVLALMGAISTVFSWNYYAQLNENIAVKVYTEFRNGFLRVRATLNGTLLGMVMGIGIAGVLLLRSERRLSSLYAVALLALFAAVTFVTGARGGWMAAIIIASTYAFFIRASRMMRSAALVAMSIGVLTIFVLIFQESDLVSDQYGTFAYRAELLRTSFEQVASRPLFGEVEFRSNPRFAHLIQGEGIVDVVNGYLQVALTYGLVGLGLFLGAHMMTLKGALKLVGSFDKKDNATHDPRMRRIAVLLVAAHFGFLSMIMTVSAVSLTWHFGYMILALSVAAARAGALNPEGSVVKDQTPQPKTVEDKTPPHKPSAVANRPKPYGARFVR